ncbi:MAG: dihydrolipoyl dehydrogenase [Candidatus Margulisbacteria bacterium]|nr:dihydrolipoyl dehydrogenase [Candidatus Margulisiibacteriota bacterium]
MSDKFDLVVLGGGPGGYVAAIRAAQLGAKVALIEKDKVGGTCLNRGCIPTKALIACTNLFDKIKKADNYGISTGEVSLDLKQAVERKDQIVAKVVKGVEFLLEKNKVEIIRGTGEVKAPGLIRVGTRDVQSQAIILATGSVPSCLPGISFDQQKFLSSDDALSLTEAPAKLNIVGGGVIGIHFAMIYSSLGTEVTIYEALPDILAGIDEEIVGLVKRILGRRKVKILTGTKFDPSSSGDKTLICVGRTPALIGIENLKLKTKGKSVAVNARLETSVAGVYAVGDLVSSKMLAHVAYEQGVVAAENALGGKGTFSYDNIPIGIYTTPEIGSIGLTEKEAREKHQEIKIGKFNYAALGIAQALGEIEGVIKVISDDKGGILGVHIIGAEATTLIGIAVSALKNKLTVNQLAGTFQSHPSYPEGLQEAALASLKKGLHSI